MTRKLILAAFLLTVVLTFVAVHHQLTNAAPNMAPPPKHAPPLEQYAARLEPEAVAAPGEPRWQVVAGGGGKANWLSDVSMTSSEEGWAVGGTGPASYGVAMHYTNTTWSRVAVPTGTYNFSAVAMISSTEGWAAGLNAICSYGTCNSGLLMHYTAATGWQTATLPARPDGEGWFTFRGMDITGTTGWIVGVSNWPSSNYFLQFNGTDWTPVLAPLQDAYDVSVVNDHEAWAVGHESMSHFSNGNWSVVTPTINLPYSAYYYLTGIHMLNVSEGWAVGYVGYWHLIESPPNHDQCLALHYDSNAWSQAPCAPELSEARLYAVRMRSPTDVRAVGRNGVMQHYDGSAWTQVAAPPGTSTLNSIRLVGSDSGWAVGWNSVILRLANGNWTRAQGSNLVSNVMDAAGANEAWFGGDAGDFYRWKGGSITAYSSPMTSPVTALDMVSPTLGWAATRQPPYYILQYSDGAWTKVYTPNWGVEAISMISPTEGWFSTPIAGLLHYSSGVWQTQSYSDRVNLSTISMVDVNHGWGTSLSSAVYTYTNGIWQLFTPTLTLIADTRILRVIGISPDEVWVAGYSIFCANGECPASPQLHHFVNGAWTSVPTPDWLAFYDISKVSATEWWATGELTTMEHAFLHYKDGTYTIVPSAGEDVGGISMLPDGTGFARGVGSLLRLAQVVAPDGVSISGPQSGGINTAHTFTATVSPVTATTPITYVWQATGQLPVTNTGSISNTVTFTWNAPGVQAITVTAMNEANAVTGIYGIAVYAPPQAAFTAAPTSGVAPMTVVFTNTSSGDYASSRWEFGDGMTSTLPSPTHTYLTPGVYGVTLTVSAPGGTVIIPGGTALLPAVSDTLARANYITVTVAQAAGVSLTSNQNGMVYPGQSIVYQHTLTNTGTGADSFTVTASIDRPGWSVMAAPSVVGPLGPGIASSVVVTVTAPSGITTTITATASITATSKFDVSVTSVVTDLTTVQPYQVYLPLVIRQ